MDRCLFTRRKLPHIGRQMVPTFVTCVTRGREVLPPGARTLALRHALQGHTLAFWMHVAVVMPDHMHLVFTILEGEFTLPRIMKGIKGASARYINHLLGRSGNLWQVESFDHVVRSYEWTRRKIEYVCNNPVRDGLVRDLDDYPWVWRSWIEGCDRGLGPWTQPPR